MREKQLRIKQKFTLEYEVSFHSYSTKAKNKKVLSTVLKTMRHALHEADFVSVWIDKEGGAWVEDCVDIRFTKLLK